MSVPDSGLPRSPWSCREEWEEVYSWLYSSDPALVRKGVGRVSAWKAREQVPMMVEMTADLCECRVCDREKERPSFQVLNLQYSMAITRFVNGIGDLAKMSLHLSANLVTCVDVYGLPSWVVTLRHSGTHEKLPSLGALRAGAEFGLSWLRANYWRPQRLTIGEQGVAKSRDATPPEGERVGFGRHSGKGKEAEAREGHIWRLTNGLCHSRDQLAAILIRADYRELSGYLKLEQLLQFSPNMKYTVTVPDLSELNSLSSLCVGEGDMAVWHTHLLRAARNSCSVRQRLVSALICAINDEECSTSLRHFLCGWLSLLWKSDWPTGATGIVAKSTGATSTGATSAEVLSTTITGATDAASAQAGSAGLTGAGAQVINIVDSGDECFLPGGLDWMELLLVAKQHPGYYLYAIINEIVRHLRSSLSESAVSNMMHLSALTTLSSRIGLLDSHTSPPLHHYHHRGSVRDTHSEELRKLWTLWDQKLTKAGSPSRSVAEGHEGGVVKRGEGETRWKLVEDMSAWVVCPIGVCPQQQVAADMLDIPLLSADGGNGDCGDGHHDGYPGDGDDGHRGEGVMECLPLHPGAGSMVSGEEMILSHASRSGPGMEAVAMSNAGRILMTKQAIVEQHSCEPFALDHEQIKRLQQRAKIL